MSAPNFNTIKEVAEAFNQQKESPQNGRLLMCSLKRELLLHIHQGPNKGVRDLEPGIECRATANGVDFIEVRGIKLIQVLEIIEKVMWGVNPEIISLRRQLNVD